MAEQDRTYHRLPYINNFTERLSKSIKSITIPSNINIAKYNPFKNNFLFTSLKDKTPKTPKSNLVYNIPYFNCNKYYVGQTSQWVRDRLVQHKSDSRIGKNSCALVQHSMNEDFSFNYQATHILNIETNYKKPLFLEMVNTIKEDTDNNNLIPID